MTVCDNLIYSSRYLPLPCPTVRFEEVKLSRRLFKSLVTSSDLYSLYLMLSLFSCWHFFTSLHISDISAVFTSSPTHPFLSCSIYLSFSLCNCSGAVQGLLVCAPAGQISIDLPRRHSWPSLHQTLVKMPAIITLASPAKVMAYIYLTHSLPPIGCEIYLSMCVCNEIIICVCVCVCWTVSSHWSFMKCTIIHISSAFDNPLAFP